MTTLGKDCQRPASKLLKYAVQLGKRTEAWYGGPFVGVIWEAVRGQSEGALDVLRDELFQGDFVYRRPGALLSTPTSPWMSSISLPFPRFRSGRYDGQFPTGRNSARIRSTHWRRRAWRSFGKAGEVPAGIVVVERAGVACGMVDPGRFHVAASRASSLEKGPTSKPCFISGANSTKDGRLCRATPCCLRIAGCLG